MAKKKMFHLIDTFNGRKISRHRTEAAAERAAAKVSRAIKRRSPGSYLPTVIAEDYPDGPGIYLEPGRYFGVGELAPVGYEPPPSPAEFEAAVRADRLVGGGDD